MAKRKMSFISLVLSLLMLFGVMPMTNSEYIAASTGVYYLESDIFATGHGANNFRSAWTAHPAGGFFNMQGVTYHQGISMGGTFPANQRFWATYDISGRNITHLSGMLGFVSGSSIASIFVVCADSGRYIGSANLAQGDIARQIYIAIPSGIQRVTITLQTSGINVRLGFGNAFFSSRDYPFADTLLPVTGVIAYLESDIFATGHGANNFRSAWTAHPANGAFIMNSINYHRGISMGGTFPANQRFWATYDISGRGFTQLTGILGFVSGGSIGSLLIVCADSGSFIGSVDLPQGAIPREINIAIPSGTQRITITLQTSGTNVRLGFGNAFFSCDTPTPTPIPVPSSTPIQNPHSYWAREELERAAQQNLIPTPLQDPSVDLRDPITRAEFAGVVVQLFEHFARIPALPAINNPFTDTQDIYVLRAFNAGIMVGVSPAEFAPDVLLNREQAATALTRAFMSSTIPSWTFARAAYYPLNFTWGPLFADDAYISYWARESVYFMAANGIIQGTGNNMFSPRAVTTAQQALGYAQATREQALLIALRMVENLV